MELPTDTEAIQAALDLSRTVRLPAGTCVVRPLFVRSDAAIGFTPQTTLRAGHAFAFPARSTVVDRYRHHNSGAHRRLQIH